MPQLFISFFLFARSLCPCCPEHDECAKQVFRDKIWAFIYNLVTRYSFQLQRSTSQLPKMVDSGVNTA